MSAAAKQLAAALLIGVAGAAAASNEPHVGFVFPAGARQGDTIEVLLGGQYFNGATNVFVSGEGVRVEIERYTIKYEQRRIGQLFRNIENAEAGLADENSTAKQKESYRKKKEQSIRAIKLIDLPDGIDRFDKKAVQRLYRSGGKKEQFNPQLSDRLRVRVIVDENAPPGERELRVHTPAGLSNPMYFQVGALEEVREAEPNDDHMAPNLQAVPVPCVVNGQIRPGDIDHFTFKAKKGDSIVIDVAARRIIPYLADAVPGWFQAVVALYDEDGNEVAYQDDYKFNPDPVLFFDVPRAGTYTLSIRDSIYRGREDFIYRIAIGELPFITSIFPLGARQGRDVDIALSGRNLPKTRLTGKLPDEGGEARHVFVEKDGYRSNPMPFAIDELEEAREAEPNNTPADAFALKRPVIVNGRIQRAGDRDVFSFHGEQGGSVSIEVVARRLNSPLDSLIVLTGPGLDKPLSNDDYVSKDATHLYLGAGLVTHHADSYLHADLPETGTYYIELTDTQGKGGHDYGYRLRVTRSNPDFQLRMEPSGARVSPGGSAAFSVRVLRQDGFEGRIKLAAENLPKGFEMSQAVIPKGADVARLTITAPKEVEEGLVSPEIVGEGLVKGKPVVRPAVPVDDQMQAFLYRHLVPARELALAPVSERPPVSFEAKLPKSGFINLVAGEETRISFVGRIESGGKKGYSLQLDDPPEGFSIPKNGWIGKRRLKEKTKDGQFKFSKNEAWGNMLISVDESVEPGTRLSLVVNALVRQGRETTLYPAPAIPVKVVAPKQP